MHRATRRSLPVENTPPTGEEVAPAAAPVRGAPPARPSGTRERRNAEKRITLDREPGRPWRRPVPLVELVCGAIGDPRGTSRLIHSCIHMSRERKRS